MIERKLQSRVEKYMKGGFKTDNTQILRVQLFSSIETELGLL